MTQPTPELVWLGWTAALTALLWLPYILNRLVEQGFGGAVLNVAPPGPAQAGWAQRLRAAHDNAAVALAIFAPLALAVVIAGRANATTALAAQAFFWARLAHAVLYTLGVPGGRTLAFSAGLACQLVMAWVLLG